MRFSWLMQKIHNDQSVTNILEIVIIVTIAVVIRIFVVVVIIIIVNDILQSFYFMLLYFYGILHFIFVLFQVHPSGFVSYSQVEFLLQHVEMYITRSSRSYMDINQTFVRIHWDLELKFQRDLSTKYTCSIFRDIN